MLAWLLACVGVADEDTACVEEAFVYDDGVADPADESTWTEPLPEACDPLLDNDWFYEASEAETAGTMGTDGFLTASLLAATVDAMQPGGHTTEEVCTDLVAIVDPTPPPWGEDPAGFCTDTTMYPAAPFTCGRLAHADAASMLLEQYYAGSSYRNASFLYMDYNGNSVGPTLIWYPVLFAAAANQYAGAGAPSVLSFTTPEGSATIGVLGLGYRVQGTENDVKAFKNLLSGPSSGLTLENVSKFKVDLPTWVMYRISVGSTTEVRTWKRGDLFTFPSGATTYDPWRFTDVTGVIDPCAGPDASCADSSGLTAVSLYTITEGGSSIYEQSGPEESYLPGYGPEIPDCDGDESIDILSAGYDPSNTDR